MPTQTPPRTPEEEDTTITRAQSKAVRLGRKLEQERKVRSRKRAVDARERRRVNIERGYPPWVEPEVTGDTVARVEDPGTASGDIIPEGEDEAGDTPEDTSE